jgi:hypothetical protein
MRLHGIAKDNMIFAKRLTGQVHTRVFTIEHHAASGWVAREQDEAATHTSMIRDWRQVEATMALFELKASALRSKGWLEIAPSP